MFKRIPLVIFPVSRVPGLLAVRSLADGVRRLGAVRKGRLRRRSTGAALALAFAALSAPGTARAVTYFTDVTSVSLPSPQPCNDPIANEGCYTNWVVASDLDGDGDLDLLTANGGGYYAVGNAEPSTIYFNDGTGAFTDVTRFAFGGAVSRLRQVSVGDIDGDGDLDLYQPGGYGLDADKLWVQTSQGVFQNQASTKLPAGSASRAGSSHLGDLDGDGDLDLVVGDWGNASTSGTSRLALYLNDGTGKFTRVASQLDPQLALEGDPLPPTIPFNNSNSAVYWGRRPIDLDFADVDGDFDLDILVNHRDGISRILINDGTAHFKDGNDVRVVTNEDGTTTTLSNYPLKRGPYAYNQELCDIDGDGDLDLLVDNAAVRPEGITSGNFTQISLNDGTGKFIDQSRDRIFGEPGSDDNAVKCVDLNNDGYLDMVVASLQSNSEKVLINDGTTKFNYIGDAIATLKDPTLGIEIADLTGDGIFDMFTGQGEGSLRLNRVFKGTGGSLRDTRAPKFRAVEVPAAEGVNGEPIVFRMAITDSVTSETGEHVKEAYATYVTSTGTGTAKAKFIGGDLFRVVIPAQPPGTTVTVSPAAADRVGNRAFSATSFSVTYPPLPDGSGGAAGASGGGGMSGGAGTGNVAGSGGASSGGGGMSGGGGDAGMSSVGGEGGAPEAGGAPNEPTAGTGNVGEAGAAGSGEEPSEGGEGGTAGKGGSSGKGGSAGKGGSSSGGKGGKGGRPSQEVGGENGDAGEDGMEPPRSSPPKKRDDGGCTVAPVGSSAPGSGGLAAALALGLSVMFRRRRRNG